MLVELRTAHPLLRIQRLADRGVGGGFAMMLAASAVLFGTFLLASLYLQNVLGTGPLETGLAFLPLAVAARRRRPRRQPRAQPRRRPRADGHGIRRRRPRDAAAVRRRRATAATSPTCCPGMLVAGLGLGVVLVCVSVSVMTGAEDEETGMLSGLNTTGHEIGGSIGIAVLATIAAGSAGSDVVRRRSPTASATPSWSSPASPPSPSLVALIVLPSAATFLPKLRLAPRVAIH